MREYSPPRSWELTGTGLFARFVLFLWPADRNAAIDGQGFKNHVEALAVVMGENNADLCPEALFSCRPSRIRGRYTHDKPALP
jgi:hypothetical protein